MAVKTELTMLVHNVIAHPVMEVLHWVGYVVPPARKLGKWIHAITIPAEGRDD